MKTLTPSETKALTVKLNTEFHPLNKTFSTGMPLRDITKILNDNDLDASKVQPLIHGDEGRLHVEVGHDIYVTMTWYRMSSGRYEIVIYASSQHDDHRDPYTKVMTTSERNKAKTRLTKALEPVNKTYYKGKAAAFGAIQDAIAAAGLDWHEWEDSTQASRVNDDQGRLNIDIGNKLFLNCTWYKMETTGNYEIVAYVSYDTVRHIYVS